MRRVVFVNRYFHPDHSATSQMASDLAFHLASRGWEVEAITSRQRYDDPRANLPPGTGESPALPVGCAGNLGRAHDVDTILAAVRMLPDVRFVFTGGGAKLDAVRGAGATKIEVRPYAPREQLSESLSSVDVHLVSLLPRLEGLIVPSKFYGVLAVARPVIFIGARDGELARIIEEHRCGIVVETADELARAIRTLEANRDEAEAMG